VPVSVTTESKTHNPDFDIEGVDLDAVSESVAHPAPAGTLPVHDEYEDAMPGYHEYDENDADIHQAAIEPENIDEIAMLQLESRSKETTSAGPSRARPPVSAPGRTLLQRVKTSTPNVPASTLADSLTSTKPHSTGHASLSSAPLFTPTSRISQRPPKRVNEDSDSQHGSSETSTCPVCGKALKIDNQGFNAHVDFCLSRGAIWEAQAQAGSPVKRNSGTAPNQDGWKKSSNQPKRRKG
jgi:DNA polymerase kappa